MFIGNKTISWIKGTSLGISVYSVNYLSMQMHPNILEIIYCLKGSVKFSYAYEEFKLNRGEFISVDKDAYFLYEGKDNTCVSFYIDLSKYEKQYPFITSTYFVCEGLKNETMHYPTKHHDQLRGMLISLLKYINNPHRSHQEYINTINIVVEKMVKLFINHFNIAFFYTGGTDIKEDMMERFHHINMYLYNNSNKEITINDIARKFNLSEGYTSEYLRKIIGGFRSIFGYFRANESVKYLLTTDKTILEISERCGFSDVKYYYSAFKKWYKCTPKQYREKYGNATKKDNIRYYKLIDIQKQLDEAIVNHYLDIYIGNSSE